MKKLVYCFEEFAFLHPSCLDDSRLKEKKYHYYFIVSSTIKYIEDIYERNNEIVFLLSDEKSEFEVVIPNNLVNCTISNISYKYKNRNNKKTALVSYVCKLEDGSEKNIIDAEFSGSAVFYFFAPDQEFEIEYYDINYVFLAPTSFYCDLQNFKMSRSFRKYSYCNDINMDISMCIVCRAKLHKTQNDNQKLTAG